jgi:hypothetical protein
VEVDGGQHAEQQSRDNTRTAFFERQGYRVCVSGITKCLGWPRPCWR